MNTMTTDLLTEIISQQTDPRIGRFTSTDISRLMHLPRKKEEQISETTKTYVLEKVAEYLSGTRKIVSSEAWEWQAQQTEQALQYYKEIAGLKVRKGTFVKYGLYAGGTPTALVGKEIIVVVKCPWSTADHIENLLINTQQELYMHRRNYWWQVQAQLLFTGRHIAHLISYDPRLDEPFKMKINIVDASIPMQLRLTQQLDVATEYMKMVIDKLSF